MRDIVILLICGVLIAAGVFIFLSRSEAPQTVALEPVQAVPMRIPNASTDPPPPPAPVRRTEPLEPRREPPPPVTRTTPPSPPTASSSADTTPEPSERPSDTPTPNPTSSASTSSNADSSNTDSTSTSTTTTPPPPATVASSLPVRNSAQGWGVQAGAFRTSANAVALRDRLLKGGLAARVEPVDNGIYRVLVGAYASAEAARAASASVLAALR